MLISALVGLINLFIKALGKLGSFLLLLLPDSPFSSLNFDIPYISSLNWVIPIDFMISVTGLWLSSILVYYSVMVVLRWIKAID